MVVLLFLFYSHYTTEAQRSEAIGSRHQQGRGLGILTQGSHLSTRASDRFALSEISVTQSGSQRSLGTGGSTGSRAPGLQGAPSGSHFSEGAEGAGRDRSEPGRVSARSPAPATRADPPTSSLPDPAPVSPNADTEAPARSAPEAALPSGQPRPLSGGGGEGGTVPPRFSRSSEAGRGEGEAQDSAGGGQSAPSCPAEGVGSLRGVEPAGGSSQRTRDQVPACPSCLAGLVTPFQCLAFPDVPDPHRSQAAHAREFGIRRGEGPSRATTSLSPPALFLIRPRSQGVERKPASRGIAFCINPRVARTEKPVVLEFLSHTIRVWGV